MKKDLPFLLAQLRLWHRWLGIGLSAFILMLACTGLFMNHKDLFLGTPTGMGLKKTADKKKPALTAQTALAQLPVSFDQALALCAPVLGDAPVDSILLKNDRGTLAYQIKTPRQAEPEYEITVNAQAGAVAVKERRGYEIKNADGSTATDWGRLALDLHIGRFFNREYGKWFVSDPTAVVMILLTLSGLGMWLLPVWRRRKSPRPFAAAPANLAAAPTA